MSPPGTCSGVSRQQAGTAGGGKFPRGLRPRHKQPALKILSLVVARNQEVQDAAGFPGFPFMIDHLRVPESTVFIAVRSASVDAALAVLVEVKSALGPVGKIGHVTPDDIGFASKPGVISWHEAQAAMPPSPRNAGWLTAIFRSPRCGVAVLVATAVSVMLSLAS